MKRLGFGVWGLGCETVRIWGLGFLGLSYEGVKNCTMVLGLGTVVELGATASLTIPDSRIPGPYA